MTKGAMKNEELLRNREETKQDDSSKIASIVPARIKISQLSQLVRNAKRSCCYHRELLERERDLLRGVSSVSASNGSSSSSGAIQAIKELLGEFDSTDNTLMN